MSLVSKVKSFFQGEPDFAQGNYSANTEINRRDFLKILGLGGAALALKPSKLFSDSIWWEDRRLIEKETNQIIEEDGIRFRIYERKEPQDPYFFDVKYMLDSKENVRRVFWGDWADKVLAPKDSIIMIYDSEAEYTQQHRDYIRQEKIYQLFAKKYLDKRTNSDFDLYEIDMKGWSKEDKKHVAGLVDYVKDGFNTMAAPTLIIISKEIYNYIRAPPMYESEKYGKVFDSIIERHKK